MANEQNLISIGNRTTSEQRNITSAGGVASGVARRRKKSLKEAADLFLSLPVADQKQLNKMAKQGIEKEDADNQMAIIVGLSMKAAKGDSKAAKVLFDLLGEDASAPPESKREEDALSKALREEAERMQNGTT